MNEASKTNKIRGEQFIDRYLREKVIDIGAANDLVCQWAERFDIEDGDANFITEFRSPGSYDTVHSSHCLEHMPDPRRALHEWWSLVKPGGFLIIVVPHEDLYEQGSWPSVFNADHKVTFRLDKRNSWSPVSFDIRDLVGALPECQILEAAVQDQGYDYSLQSKHGDRVRQKPFALVLIEKICRRIPVFGTPFRHVVENIAFRFGIPVDQTMREALAQIQVIAKKAID